MSDETPDQTPAGKKSSRSTLLIVGGIAAAAIVIGTGSAIFLLGGDDEVETRATCQGAAYEVSAERDSEENNRMTASFEAQVSQPDERWNIAIVSNGDVKYDETVTADSEGEIDAGVLLGIGEQKQDIEFRFGPADGEQCTATLALE